MLPRVNRLLALWIGRSALAAVVCLAAVTAHAQQGALFADDRWIPSFAITSGAFWGVQHATVSSDCFAPGTDQPTSCDPQPGEEDFGSVLRPGEVDHEPVVTTYVGGNLSLSTPALPVPGRLRLF